MTKLAFGSGTRRIIGAGFAVEEGMLDRLANEIIEHAKVGGITIATAESCSAGRLAQALAKAEGASTHYLGGVVAYTKQMKERMLGVPPQLLQEKTAVCGPVAEAMAIGVLLKSAATVAVSVTGVAGPDEDEDGNPVGLVYCAVAPYPAEVQRNARRHHRGGLRRGLFLLSTPPGTGGPLPRATSDLLRGNGNMSR